MPLRDYQQDSISALRDAFRRGKRAPLLVQPCGTGKTYVATEIIKNATEKGQWVIFLAPRRELIYQTSDNLIDHHQHEHGIIMAGVRREYSTVQICSFDTLWARAKATKDGEELKLPRADVVLVDESHLSIAPTRKKIIDHYRRRGAVVIGMTATPARGDGRGLGEIYDELIVTRDARWYIEHGHLVPARYFAPDKPDLEKIGIRAGDYVIEELGDAMDQPKLVGNVVKQWHRLAAGKSTVVFCVNRAHSRHLAKAFAETGVSAEHLDGETPTAQREAILARVASGETTVLCNVFVATYGLDIPSLEVAVLARPTKNIALYIQTIGRVMRPSPGKVEALVIDHAGAVAENGLFDDPIEWSLDPKSKVKERREAALKEREEPKDITCSECQYVFRAAMKCPRCGHEMYRKAEDVPYHKAELKEVDTAGGAAKRANREWSWDRKVEFFSGLKYYAFDRNYRPGWAAWSYREKFGVWPNDRRLQSARPKPPNGEVLGWVKHLQIRNAHRRRA